MKFRFLLVAFLALCLSAHAHVGSPDVFYDAQVGPWPTHITIRMPNVVPGLAEIIAQVQSTESVTVTFTPLSSKISTSNAPPPDVATAVPGQTNLYTGNLWLMTTGAYSIDVHIHSASADASVLIPVNSVAMKQLPLPSWLGGILAALAMLLFAAGMVIVAAAAGQSTLAPGAEATAQSRRKYFIAFIVTGLVLVVALYGGKKWWDKDENEFRGRLRDGGWPDMESVVRIEGSQRILHFDLGKNDFGPNDNLDLTLDHGKLLHLFVISLPDHRAIAHLHPFQRDGKTFELPLPPLPEGDYELFCDCTFSSGLSSTATNTVHLPAVPSTSTVAHSFEPDPDDSFAVEAAPVAANASADTAFRFPDGSQILWKAHDALHPNQNAGLRFQVLDASGHPARLQPYMGMMSHAAILRSDNKVFAHLHPTGNYSMAAQMIFDDKMKSETGATASMTMITPTPDSTVSIPYEFPTTGSYNIWVQIKTNDHIQTAAFSTAVN